MVKKQTTQAEINQVLLEELLKIQIDAEIKMLEKVAKRVKKGITAVGWNENKLADVQLLRKEIEAILADKDKVTNTYINKSFIKAYDSAGSKVYNKILKSPHHILQAVNIPAHLQRIILETQNAISGTSFQILRNVNDVYREVISEATTGVLTGVETRLQVSQQALNNFAAKGVTGFIDKAGRNWELASYVEMAVRTGAARAALQGHVDTSLRLGVDLMIVSSHSNTCPLCAPWGGKVISITGKTPNYPTLEQAKAAGLFHPNCKHTLTVYLPELDDLEDDLDDHFHMDSVNLEKYEAIQRQRYNERQIRKWKRIEAVALTPEEKIKAHNKVLQWQKIQREHVNNWDLTRRYKREGIKNRIGDATKASKKPELPKDILPKAEPKTLRDIQIVNYEELEKGNVKLTFRDGKSVTVQLFSNNQVISNPYLKDINSDLISSYDGGDLDRVLTNLKNKLPDLEYDVKAYNKANKWIKEIENVINDAKVTTKPKVKKELTKPKPITKKESKEIKVNKPNKKAQSSYKAYNEVYGAKKDIQKQLNYQYSNWDELEDKWTEQMDTWYNKLSDDEKSAIRNYTGPSYKKMNEYLRSDGKNSTDYKEEVEKVIKALDKIKTEEDMVVRRGVSTRGFAGMFDKYEEAKNIGGYTWIEKNMDSLIGQVCTDKGFLSTSPNKFKGFDKEVNLKIELPKGTKGAYIDSISKHRGEKEFLIQKGYNYIVTGIERTEKPEMGEDFTVFLRLILPEQQ